VRAAVEVAAAPDAEAEARAYLDGEIRIAIEKGFAIPSIIDHLIEASAPLAEDEVRGIVAARYAEADAARARLIAEGKTRAEADEGALSAVDIAKKRKDLERALREDARVLFLFKKGDPAEVLASTRKYNAGYTYGLDPEDLPALVFEEYERARKTRLPISKLWKQDNHYTEMGLAERFIAQHWEAVLYCSEMKAWLVWNDRVWVQDHADAIRRKAKKTAARLYSEVERIEDPEVKKTLLTFAKKTESARTLSAVLELVRSEVPIAVAELDADPTLFNVRNGTVELTTGRFRGHRPEDYLTKTADVDYVAGAKCPVWEKHLDRIFAGSAEAIAGFQLMCGYSLLADNPAEVFFILHGQTGSNGKSKTLEVLSSVWGDYAKSADASKLLIKRRNNDGPKTELADLVGARLVTTSESAEGAKFDEEAIKSMTGRDKVKCRRLYEREFEYVPGYKIMYATNHKPGVSTDSSIWRRIWLVPFTVEIPLEERDEKIAEKMLAERAGILNWCLDGLKRYREAGRLVQPECFKAATTEYRKEADVVSRFIGDECVITGEESDFIPRNMLYAAYVSWAKDNGETVVSTHKFAAKLGEAGVFKDPAVAHVYDDAGKRIPLRYYRKVRFKYLDEEAEPPPLGG
jgi:putative DNA primase/helicase